MLSELLDKTWIAYAPKQSILIIEMKMENKLIIDFYENCEWERLERQYEESENYLSINDAFTITKNSNQYTLIRNTVTYNMMEDFTLEMIC